MRYPSLIVKPVLRRVFSCGVCVALCNYRDKFRFYFEILRFTYILKGRQTGKPRWPGGILEFLKIEIKINREMIYGFTNSWKS